MFTFFFIGLLSLLVLYFISDSYLPSLDFSAKSFFLPSKKNIEFQADFFQLSSPSVALLPPSLEEELFCVIKKKKPDISKDSFGIEMVFPKSKQRQTVDIGEKVYLGWNKKKGFFLSKKKSSLWLEPTQIQEEKLICSIGVGLDSQEKIFPGFLFIRKEEGIFEEKSPFEELSSAQWRGQDLLSKFWNSTLENQERVEILQKPLFIKKGDLLAWKKKWVVIQDPEEGHMIPLALLEEISPQEMVFLGWDATGEKSFKITIPLVLKEKTTNHSEKMFSSLRMRTKNQVSLQLNHQRFFLRPGDWLVEKQGKWKRVMKREGDLKPSWSTINATSFFYFQSMEFKEEKFLLKGFRLDGSGTECVPIQEEISLPNKKGKKSIRCRT